MMLPLTQMHIMTGDASCLLYEQLEKMPPQVNDAKATCLICYVGQRTTDGPEEEVRWGGVDS